MKNRKGAEKLAEHEKNSARERKIQTSIETLIAELSPKCRDIRHIVSQPYKVLLYLPEQHYMVLETATHRYGVCYKAHRIGMKGTGTFIYDFPRGAK